MLIAAASADTSYYEAYGAPVAKAGVVSRVTKIGVGLELSEDQGISYVTHDVTAVLESITTSEETLD